MVSSRGLGDVYKRQALGRISAPGFFTDVRLRWAYTRAAWRGDSPGSINPKDEVTAWLNARDGRLATSEQASWELYGTDWNESYPVMLAEHNRMAADGTLPAPKAGAAAPVSYTHLTLPTIHVECRSRWSPYH